jgi:hypothetical protein
MAAGVKRENDLAVSDSYCCHPSVRTVNDVNVYDHSLERGRLSVVLATIVINVVAVSF